MKQLRQVAAVTAMNMRSLPQRWSSSIVIVIGIAGVVAVLVSVLAMSTGMIKTLQSSGRADRVLIVRSGAQFEAASALSRETVRLLSEADGLKRNAEGQPLVSAESFRILNLFKKADGTEVNVQLRGVGPLATEVRPELKIVAGRMFNPAVTEVIVGKAARAQFRGLEIGDQIRTRNAIWTVVGEFTTNGDAHESELMTDVETLVSAERNGFQSMTAMLASAQAFQVFKDAVTSTPGLSVDVERESDYLKRTSSTISQVIAVVAYVVGGIMAVGALFAALNTMYTAVSARVREIATLRALGFGPSAVVVSVMVEALLLSIAGGVVGAALAWLFFHGNTASTSGGGVAGQLVFELAVSPPLVVLGIVWACCIGFVGGLFPALRAARLPVAAALRAM